MLSFSTDYVSQQNGPEECVRLIAEAGFTHVHWCHDWYSDHLYSDEEMVQISKWLHANGLRLNDTHGSEGIKKFWYAQDESARQAGVALVKNRIELTARLGGDAVVMHVYPSTADPKLAHLNTSLWDRLRKSLDELEPFARMHGVRLAIENLIDFAGVKADAVTLANAQDNVALLQQIFAHYPPDVVGFCYDTGHAMLGHNRMAAMTPLLERLAVLHLHDNDGASDQHLPLFQAAIDWPFVASQIAQSPYTKPLGFETCITNSSFEDDATFIAHGLETGIIFAQMVEDAR